MNFLLLHAIVVLVWFSQSSICYFIYLRKHLSCHSLHLISAIWFTILHFKYSQNFQLCFSLLFFILFLFFIFLYLIYGIKSFKEELYRNGLYWVHPCLIGFSDFSAPFLVPSSLWYLIAHYSSLPSATLSFVIFACSFHFWYMIFYG